MAGTGMALRRGANNHGSTTEGGDDVQSSIELLDRVLSEFDDLENANQVPNTEQMANPTVEATNNVHNTPGNVSSTPEDESPSLGGHQSEDDGYMSMNGRKAKFALSFKPVTEATLHQEATGMPCGELHEFPPPPEEAERLIATLLPRVSPANSVKKNNARHNRTLNQTSEIVIPPPRIQQRPPEVTHIINGQIIPINTATQTTLPKTRHQRPYGWETQDSNFRLHPAPTPPGCRYGSLPFSHGQHPITSPTRVPPRTVPTVVERHREVRRRSSEDNLSSEEDNAGLRPLSELADDERFSDDSLEEMLPPPPPVCNKRSSIAWEVPLDGEDPLLTPGSTKVVGRRRRKSGENSHSSTSSIPNRLRELDDWPEPPPCNTEDEVVSPFSDSDDPVVLPKELNSSTLSGSGTYIIRRNKKDRKPVMVMSTSQTSNSSLNSRLSSDLSIPHSRFSTDLNSRLSRELYMPNSRYSVDLSPQSRMSQELNSPKSRYSLDLNNSKHDDFNSSSRFSTDLSSRSSTPQGKILTDFKKHSTTFDNIKSLMREGVIETYEPNIEMTTEFINSKTPLVRVVSLPTLSAEEYTPRRELAVTVEEEEDVESPRQNSTEISPLRKIEQNISELLERRDIDVSSLMKDEKRILQINGVNQPKQEKNNHNEIQRSEDYFKQLREKNEQKHNYNHKRNGIQKSESAKEMLLSHLDKEPDRPMTSSTSADFPIKVEIVQHDFPPLPPSPVEEDDEYSEILHPIQMKTRADTLPVMPSESSYNNTRTKEPPAIPPHREPGSNSLKTRSMDGGIGRGRRSNILNNSGRTGAPERRTLPTELPGTKRKTFYKRSCQSPREEHHMQTSCSLPETPIFARGCDVPRTPHRRAPEIPGHRTAPRQSNTMGAMNTLENVFTNSYRRGVSNSNLEQALVGAELLRLAGGPGRGWYPRHRNPRPASIEHLDRLTPNHGHNPWDGGSRKPLTLPPNLTPKFFQRSPREALRRVTSLLIRKGNNGKEPKKEKDQTQPSNNFSNSEDGQKKKGFFKSLWKRSRHYSLEQQ